LRSDLDFTPMTQILGSGLHSYLDGLQISINEIDNALHDDFIDRRLEVASPETQFQFQSQRYASGSH
jgi:hypothetical protein